MAIPQTIVVKVLIKGAAAAGKSEFSKRFISQDTPFNSTYTATLGADFAVKNIPIGSNKTIKFRVWDTAGQGRFESIAQMYESNSTVMLYAVDLAEAMTDARREEIKKDISSFKDRNPGCFVILLGTKIDCCSEKAANEILDDIDVDVNARVATSAKNHTGFDQITNTMVNYAESLPAVDMQTNPFFNTYTVPSFTRIPTLTSSLSKDQQRLIANQVRRLVKERDSCWPYPNKKLKQVKINALNYLLEQAMTKMPEEAINETKNKYPAVTSGTFSKR